MQKVNFLNVATSYKEVIHKPENVALLSDILCAVQSPFVGSLSAVQAEHA